MNFKKVERQAGQFFKKDGTGQKLLRKAGKVAGAVGAGLAKAAPALAVVSPALASGAALAGGLLSRASKVKNLKEGLELAKEAKTEAQNFV
jgi:hypothetical protein